MERARASGLIGRWYRGALPGLCLARGTRQILAVLAGGVMWASAISSAFAWTDDPLLSGTPIKAVHFTELRSAIDTKRQACGLGAYPWSSGPIDVGGSIVAAHINELRTAVLTLDAPEPAKSNLNAVLPVSAGASIQAIQITRLREALDTATCPTVYYCTTEAACTSQPGPCPGGKTCYATQADCLANACTNCPPPVLWWCTTTSSCASGSPPCPVGKSCSCTQADCLSNAPSNCPAACGDGSCTGSETCTSCPADCGACGCNNNGVCEPQSEDLASCPSDCESSWCLPGTTQTCTYNTTEIPQLGGEVVTCSNGTQTCQSNSTWGVCGPPSGLCVPGSVYETCCTTGVKYCTACGYISACMGGRPEECCGCFGWRDEGCGQDGCAPTAMYQTRECPGSCPECNPPSDCDDQEAQCVANHPSCTLSCSSDGQTRSCTINGCPGEQTCTGGAWGSCVPTGLICSPGDQQSCDLGVAGCPPGGQTCNACGTGWGACLNVTPWVCYPLNTQACTVGGCPGTQTCLDACGQWGTCTQSGDCCGDGSCTGSETCSSCPSDCGACPSGTCSCGTCEGSGEGGCSDALLGSNSCNTGFHPEYDCGCQPVDPVGCEPDPARNYCTCVPD